MKTEGNELQHHNLKFFPSLKRIKDEEMREKVASVWNEAITMAAAGAARPSCRG